MATFRFVVEMEFAHNGGPRIAAAELPDKLAEALDLELPTSLWVQREDADTDTDYTVGATRVTAVA